ncbi:uncharacterized protein LOC112126648 [Cimex lectularius]|uniref:Type VII secretion system protein EssD-like domain-containing protein n=1 Tax=Cimex lectularius TaxID=79782 RepID=A0A8I6SFS1_CIMLE|nr:uncharacterized protein LOC112126648 [Cimex lectularius]
MGQEGHTNKNDKSVVSQFCSESKLFFSMRYVLKIFLLLFLLGGISGRRSTGRKRDDSPVRRTETGFKGRVEYAEAEIEPKHLDRGTKTNKRVRTYSKDMGYESDDAGHVIARRLGGDGKDEKNIIPQNPSVNRGEWKKIEDLTYAEVKKTGKVKMQVEPIYSGEKSTRPKSIYYRISSKNGNRYKKVESGEVENR